LGDPRVVDINQTLWKIILYLFVLPFRPKKSAQAYSRIWDGSGFPLVKITELFAQKLKPHLDDNIELNHCFLLSNPRVEDLFLEWEKEVTGMVDFVTKGSNLNTEHYSAVKAEVPDPADDTTQLNQQLIDMLQDSDVILIAGEALDYCVANSIRDIATSLGVDNAKKIKILEDCTSAIDPSTIPKIKSEFAALGIEFVDTNWFGK
jgi:hypothetical protein